MHRFAVLVLSSVVMLAVPARGMAQPASPADPAASSAAAAPPADVRTTYDAAFAALLAGRLAEAQRGFADVAALSPDSEMGAAARELGRLAATLQERRIRLVAEAGAAPPSELPPVAPDSDGGAKYEAEDRTAGRTSFVISTTMASIYGGIVLVDLLDVGGDFRPAVATVLASTGLGFLGSYYGSRGAHITEAMADAYTLGMGLGVGNGLLLLSPLGLDGSSEQVQGTALGSLVVGGAAGMFVAHRFRPTRGQVQVASLASSLGIATTGLGLAIAQPDSIEGDTLLTILAGGLDLGLVAGMSLAPQLDWSLSRARLVSLGGFLGALVTWSTAALLTGTDLDADTGRLWAGSTLAGLWGGVILSTRLTKDMDPDRRFASNGGFASTAMIAPAPVPGGMGLALSGSF